MDIFFVFAVGFVLGLYIATQIDKSDTFNQNHQNDQIQAFQSLFGLNDIQSAPIGQPMPNEASSNPLPTVPT